MSLDDYKLLLCWIKEKLPEEAENLRWNTSLTKSVPTVWEYIGSCHTGEFFLKILVIM